MIFIIGLYRIIASIHCIDWPPISFRLHPTCANISHVAPYQGCRSFGPKKGTHPSPRGESPKTRALQLCSSRNDAQKFHLAVTSCCQLDRPFSAFLSQKKRVPHENRQLQAGLKIGYPMSQKFLLHHRMFNICSLICNPILNYCYQIAVVVAF